MARCTVGAEVGVRRIRRRQIDVMMTCIALDRRAAETVVHMALEARDGIMCPARRELCPVVIKARLPRCRRSRVAKRAICRKPCGAVIDRDCIVIVTCMTGIACSRRAGKMQIDVTAFARGCPVLAHQEIPGFRVIESHRIGHRCPAVRCVAVGTLVRQFAVRGVLRKRWRTEKQQYNDQRSHSLPHFIWWTKDDHSLYSVFCLLYSCFLHFPRMTVRTLHSQRLVSHNLPLIHFDFRMAFFTRDGKMLSRELIPRLPVMVEDQ